MRTVPDPDEKTQSWRDTASERLWDLRGYTRQGIDDVLWGAVLDRATPDEAARRVEAFLTSDERGTVAHNLWGVLTLLASLRARIARGRRSLLPRLIRMRPTRRERVWLSLIDEELRRLTPKPRRHLPRDLAVEARTRTVRNDKKPDPLVDAKIRHPKGEPTAWVARCGSPRRGGCDGVLGWFVDVAEMGPDAFAHYPPEMRPTGGWVLRSRHGYGGDRQRGYVVLKERPGSRRPLPDCFGNVGGRLDWAGYWDGFVGQLPQPPCVVVCPACGMRNAVGFPPADADSL
jgi:hypothetical protein